MSCNTKGRIGGEDAVEETACVTVEGGGNATETSQLLVEARASRIGKGFGEG